MHSTESVAPTRRHWRTGIEAFLIVTEPPSRCCAPSAVSAKCPGVAAWLAARG